MASLAQELYGTFEANAQNRGRAGTRPHHAAGLVLVHHANGIGAMQAGRSGLHCLKQVSGIEAVYEVCYHFCIRLAGEHIAFAL